MADYDKTVIDNVLVGMYYYILDTLGATTKDNKFTGMTSCIENISLNPFLEMTDVKYVPSEFDSKRFVGEIIGSSENPTVYRIKEFKGKDKDIGTYNIKSEYNSLPMDYETKLLLYPFRYFILTDYINPPMLIKPQYMQRYGDNWKFRVHIALSNTSKYVLYPLGYKGDTVGNLEGIVNNNPLLLPVVSNQYSAWITSQGNTFSQSNLLGLMENQLENKLANRNNAMQTVSGIVNGMHDLYSWYKAPLDVSGRQGRQGILQMGGSLVQGFENMYQNNQRYELKEYQINSLALARKQDYLNTPNVIKTIGNDTVFNLSNARRKVELIEYGLKQERRFRIENYFKRYGYKINNYEIPNYKSRKYYNFVKTINCNIDSGAIPHGDIIKLQQIFDSGVTFWHVDNGATVKNYDVENIEL